jgi:hypothetical protein
MRHCVYGELHQLDLQKLANLHFFDAGLPADARTFINFRLNMI